MKHDLKLNHKHFEKMRRGRLMSNVRLNDRNYKVGDYVSMHDYYPNEKFVSPYYLYGEIRQVIKLDDIIGKNGYVLLHFENLIYCCDEE